MPCRRQGRVVGLRGAHVRRQFGLQELVLVLAPPVRVVPALVVLAVGGLLGQLGVVPAHHQFHVLEAHVGPHPVLPVLMGAGAAFGPPRGLEGVEGGEVCLADEAGPVAGLGELPGEPGRTDGIGQVDPVVPHAVGAR